MSAATRQAFRARLLAAVLLGCAAGVLLWLLASGPRFDDTGVLAVGLVLAAGATVLVSGVRRFRDITFFGLIPGLPVAAAEAARSGLAVAAIPLTVALVGGLAGGAIARTRVVASPRSRS